MSIHHIFSPREDCMAPAWLISRRRTEASDGSGFKLCLLRFPEMWILWVGFGVPQQLFVATWGVRQFFSCLPRGVSSIPRGPVRRLHRTPPLHHLLPLSSQDAFRYAGQRAPAAPLDVKHLSTDHLHLGASLPGTGISVFSRAQRASRLPCAPPPRYLSLPFYLSCLTGLTPSSLSYPPSLPVGPDLDLDAKIACRCSSTTSTHPHRLGRHPLHFFLLYTVFQSEIYYRNSPKRRSNNPLSNTGGLRLSHHTYFDRQDPTSSKVFLRMPLHHTSHLHTISSQRQEDPFQYRPEAPGSCQTVDFQILV